MLAAHPAVDEFEETVAGVAHVGLVSRHVDRVGAFPVLIEVAGVFSDVVGQVASAERLPVAVEILTGFAPGTVDPHIGDSLFAEAFQVRFLEFGAGVVRPLGEEVAEVLGDEFVILVEGVAVVADAGQHLRLRAGHRRGFGATPSSAETRPSLRVSIETLTLNGCWFSVKRMKQTGAPDSRRKTPGTS